MLLVKLFYPHFLSSLQLHFNPAYLPIQDIAASSIAVFHIRRLQVNPAASLIGVAQIIACLVSGPQEFGFLSRHARTLSGVARDVAERFIAPRLSIKERRRLAPCTTIVTIVLIKL